MRVNKYLNKKTEVDGILFDSKKEALYYINLKTRLKEGEISDLRLQVAYEIIPAVYKEEVVHLKTKDKILRRCISKPAHYVADFVYKDKETGEEIVVDVKSEITRKNPEYRLKKKMMLAFNGITIREV